MNQSRFFALLTVTEHRWKVRPGSTRGITHMTGRVYNCSSYFIYLNRTLRD